MAEDEETEKFLRFCALPLSEQLRSMAAHERAEAHNFEENCTWLGVFRPGHQQRKIAEILEQAADLVAAAQQPDQRAPGVRGQATLYVCRIDHPNDVIAAENIMEAMKLHGIGCRLIEFPRAIGRSCSSA
jgi:hypothetical protein